MPIAHGWEEWLGILSEPLTKSMDRSARCRERSLVTKGHTSRAAATHFRTVLPLVVMSLLWLLSGSNQRRKSADLSMVLHDTFYLGRVSHTAGLRTLASSKAGMGQQGDSESRDEANDGVCPFLRGRTMEVDGRPVPWYSITIYRSTRR